MLLLALDTSGAAVTAAVHDGRTVLAEHRESDARRHAELLAPAVGRVLADAGADRRDLTHVAAGVGPGPFTGLRVGLVTARVLGNVLGVPVLGVCSLDALADAVCAAADAGSIELPRRFAVATDARRREVYRASYSRPGPDGTPWVRDDGPHVSTAADLTVRPVVGRGAALYPEVLGAPVAGAPLDVSAGALAQVAVRGLTQGPDGGLLLPPDPLYLRTPDAVEPGTRKRVLR